jgi:hypothetical protein
MTLDSLYDALNVVLNTHKSGNKLTPKEFNALLAVENINFLKQKVEEIQGYRNSLKDTVETMLSSKYLNDIIAVQNITPATGVYALTGLTHTFGYWLSAMTTASYNGSIKSIELVTPGEYENRQVNLLKKPIKYFPIATIKGTSLYILPTDIGTVEFTYIKLPTTPVYDYYIDANRNIVYLTAGESYTLDTDEVGPQGEGATETITSRTVELSYGQQMYAEFYEFLLLRLGIRAKETIVAQHAKQEQTEDKAI